MTLEDKISALRKSQRETHQLVDEIFSHMESKCDEALLDVLETILDNIDSFPDTDSAVRAVYSLTGKELNSSSSSKKDKKDKKKHKGESADA